MTEQPERKHVVGIKISADTWDDVVGALRDIQLLLRNDGPGRRCIIVGSSFNYLVFDQTSPEMTHDKYFAAIDAWLEEENEKEKVPA